MCIGKMCFTKLARHYSGYASLVLRVVLGIIFAAHGYQKFFQAGIPKIMELFANNFGLPGYLGVIVGSIELIGGMLLIIGLFTRLSALLIAAVMAGAIVTVKLNAGLLGGYELELALLAGAVSLFLLGAQKISLDNYILKKEL